MAWCGQLLKGLLLIGPFKDYILIIRIRIAHKTHGIINIGIAQLVLLFHQAILSRLKISHSVLTINIFERFELTTFKPKFHLGLGYTVAGGGFGRDNNLSWVPTLRERSLACSFTSYHFTGSSDDPGSAILSKRC